MDSQAKAVKEQSGKATAMTVSINRTELVDTAHDSESEFEDVVLGMGS
jgi:hypothetical protein